MPYEPEPNIQLCTFSTATDLAARLVAIGISCGTIFEIGSDGVRVDTTSDRYEDSGGENQYICEIWGGPEQSLAMTNAMFEEKGYTYETFSKLAAVSNVAPIEPAILNLKGNIEAVNRNLAHQMKPDPEPPSQPGRPPRRKP